MKMRTVILVAALTASGLPLVASADEATTDTATLSFSSTSPGLAGTLYGIESIDAYPQTVDKQLHTDFAAGRRTVWYSCPTTPRTSVAYDFAAGGKYELVCNPGQDGEIRRIDEC